MKTESSAESVSKRLAGKSGQKLRDGVLVANEWFYENIDSIIQAKEKSLQELYERLVQEYAKKKMKRGQAE